MTQFSFRGSVDLPDDEFESAEALIDLRDPLRVFGDALRKAAGDRAVTFEYGTASAPPVPVRRARKPRAVAAGAEMGADVATYLGSLAVPEHHGRGRRAAG